MFEMTESIDTFVLCLTFLLCYAIADLKQEREESRREREAASNAAYIILARIAVARCKLYLSYRAIIKSFHVGSLFELDVVLSSGCAWAWLGGSSSSQILRETVFVHEGPAIPTPEETPSVEI